MRKIGEKNLSTELRICKGIRRAVLSNENMIVYHTISGRKSPLWASSPEMARLSFPDGIFSTQPVK